MKVISYQFNFMCHTNCCSSKAGVGLAVLRIFVGGTFVFHGVLKAMNMADTVGFFGQIGFSSVWAYIVTAVEILGGLALVLGVFTLYGAVLLGIVMAVAAFKVKWMLPGVPFMGKYLASEIDLILLASLITVATAGPGSWSLNSFFGKKETCDCNTPNTPSNPTV